MTTVVNVADIADLDDTEEKVITDDYVLVSDGTCKVTHTQLYFNKDGSPKTHVITVKYNQETD